MEINTDYVFFLENVDEVTYQDTKQLKLVWGCVTEDVSIVEKIPVQPKFEGSRLADLMVRLGYDDKASLKVDPFKWFMKGMHISSQIGKHYREGKYAEFKYKLVQETIKPASPMFKASNNNSEIENIPDVLKKNIIQICSQSSNRNEAAKTLATRGYVTVSAFVKLVEAGAIKIEH